MSDEPSTAFSFAKIDRADENIRNLQRECSAFVDSDPYAIVREFDTQTDTCTITINRMDEVPLPLRVLVGEIVYHLRSAFDVLVYQLMRKANVTDEKRLRSSAFPVILDDISTSEGLLVYKSAMGRQIKGVSTQAATTIETLQPCHAGHTGRSNPLAQIDHLNNIDKHRLLLALVSATRVSGWNFDDGTGKTVVVPARSYLPLNEGAFFKIQPIRPEMRVNPKLPVPLEVTFGEPGVFRNKPVVSTLKELSDFARATLRFFERDFA